MLPPEPPRVRTCQVVVGAVDSSPGKASLSIDLLSKDNVGTSGASVWLNRAGSDDSVGYVETVWKMQLYLGILSNCGRRRGK